MAKRRPSIYEFAGGAEAFLALAAATHERCLQDPELNHPFSHTSDPNHLEHLAAYWAEALGGPARYSESLGGQAAMLMVHAGQGSAPDFPQPLHLLVRHAVSARRDRAHEIEQHPFGTLQPRRVEVAVA